MININFSPMRIILLAFIVVVLSGCIGHSKEKDNNIVPDTVEKLESQSIYGDCEYTLSTKKLRISGMDWISANGLGNGMNGGKGYGIIDTEQISKDGKSVYYPYYILDSITYLKIKRQFSVHDSIRVTGTSEWGMDLGFTLDPCKGKMLIEKL